MKEIKACIKSPKLSEETLALLKAKGLTGMSIMDGIGFGRGKAKGSPHRVVDDLIDFILNVEIGILCREELDDDIVSTI